MGVLWGFCGGSVGVVWGFFRGLCGGSVGGCVGILRWFCRGSVGVLEWLHGVTQKDILFSTIILIAIDATRIVLVVVK